MASLDSFFLCFYCCDEAKVSSPAFDWHESHVHSFWCGDDHDDPYHRLSVCCFVSPGEVGPSFFSHVHSFCDAGRSWERRCRTCGMSCAQLCTRQSWLVCKDVRRSEPDRTRYRRISRRCRPERFFGASLVSMGSSPWSSNFSILWSPWCKEETMLGLCI